MEGKDGEGATEKNLHTQLTGSDLPHWLLPGRNWRGKEGSRSKWEGGRAKKGLQDANPGL